MTSFGKKNFFEHHPIREDPPVAIGRPSPHSSQLKIQIQIQLQILTQIKLQTQSKKVTVTVNLNFVLHPGTAR